MQLVHGLAKFMKPSVLGSLRVEESAKMQHMLHDSFTETTNNFSPFHGDVQFTTSLKFLNHVG